MPSQAHRPERPATYAAAGVDIDAGSALVEAIKPLVRQTRRPGADGEIGGFGGVFDLKAAGYADPLMVAATDGVGTKLRIAIDTGILDTIGIDLVAMCVNDVVVQGAEPLFLLDYYATSRLDPAAGAAVVKGIAEGCRLARVALIGGETAEMPGMYAGNDFDVAGFSVGAVERDQLLPRGDIVPGDVVLALASSGLHANGFSLVRRIVADADLALDAPAPFDSGNTLGSALLVPTRIYVGALLQVIRATGAVKALAHVTGGGIGENLARVLPAGAAARIDLARLAVPPVMRWLASLVTISETEMLRTFNCGAGMLVVTTARDAAGIASTLTAMGETVVEVGRIEERSGAPVTFDGRLDLAWSR